MHIRNVTMGRPAHASGTDDASDNLTAALATISMVVDLLNSVYALFHNIFKDSR